MAYRNDVEALRARQAALARQIAALTRERNEVARLLADTRACDEAIHQLSVHPSGHRAGRFEPPRPRRPLRGSAIVVLAIVAVAGYFHTRSDRNADFIDEYSVFTDQMCRCSDSACVKAVARETSKWSVEAHEDGSLKFDEAQKQELGRLTQRMASCMSKPMSVASTQKR